jgi:serine/threonine protein kinase
MCRDDLDNDDFDSRYCTGWFPKALGSGQFSKAYRCWRTGSSKGFAMKEFLTAPGAAQHAANEILVLRALGKHPRITQLVDADDEDLGSMRFVLELCEGGQLFDRLSKKGAYEESQAKLLLRQVLEAVSFLHSKGIMHRDLKPENVLLVSRDSDTDVKVCDFGLAKMATSSQPGGPRSSSFAGSNFYLAPEMLMQKEYGPEVDIWAVGVMSYAVLSGTLPFGSDDLKETYRRIIDRRLYFKGEAWERMESMLAVNFVSHLLTSEPSKRPTAVQAMDDAWMVQNIQQQRAEADEEDEEDEDDEALSQMSEDDDESRKSVVEVNFRGRACYC